MTSPAESIQIENVVATTGINQELDLSTLETDLPTADYRPDEFPGIIYRIENPPAVVLIFQSGKLVCTGAKSVSDVTSALRDTFDAFRDLDIRVKNTPEITVQNMVSTAELDQRLNLHSLAVGLGLEKTEYEPEQFPGLVYRLDEPEGVVLFFGSGNVILTGITTITETKHLLEEVTTRLTDLELLN